MSKCTPIPTLSQLGSKNPLTLIEGAPTATITQGRLMRR